VKDHLLFLLFTKTAGPRKMLPRSIAPPHPLVGALVTNPQRLRMTYASQGIYKILIKIYKYCRKRCIGNLFNSISNPKLHSNSGTN